MNSNSNTLETALQQFIGSSVFYRIPLINLKITEGIAYLAEHGHCHWLVNDALIMCKGLQHKCPFIVIDFKRLTQQEQQHRGYEAQVKYSDGNANVLETQPYKITDFPMDALRMYFVNEMLMLPREY